MTRAPSVQVLDLVRLTDFSVSTRDVRRMERRLLRKLDFRLDTPTSVNFSGYYLRLAEIDDGVGTPRKVSAARGVRHLRSCTRTHTLAQAYPHPGTGYPVDVFCRCACWWRTCATWRCPT